MSDDKKEVVEEPKFRLRTIVADQDVIDLRKPSEEVTLSIGDNSGNAYPDGETNELIQALKDYVTEHEGLGMAAVQLGVHKRLFVMRRPFNSDKLLVVINPKILRTNGKSTKSEGCFSIPDLPGRPMITRASMIWVNFTDESGVEYKDEMLVGMDARIFQHEYEHLEGNLLIDKTRYGNFKGWAAF
jgi:peptide deformylase